MMPACSPHQVPGCACRRQGSSDVSVDITMELDQAHPTCKLDAALAKVAGFERGTWPGAVAAVHDYIRKHGLQVRCSQACPKRGRQHTGSCLPTAALCPSFHAGTC